MTSLSQSMAVKSALHDRRGLGGDSGSELRGNASSKNLASKRFTAKPTHSPNVKEGEYMTKEAR
jgi:hypothetical protein